MGKGSRAPRDRELHEFNAFSDRAILHTRTGFSTIELVGVRAKCEHSTGSLSCLRSGRALEEMQDLVSWNVNASIAVGTG